MRLIDADELINGRVENDPVKLAVESEPTVTLDKVLPDEPIDCAKMLILATYEYETSLMQRALGASEKKTACLYSINELRQIAGHLLVYCNHMESEDD